MKTPVVDFIPTADPLMRDPCLAYAVELPVLGIATRFETNSRYVHDLALEAFGSWSCLPLDLQAFPSGGLRVRIVVREGEEGTAGGHTPVRYFLPDAGREVMHSPGSLAIADPLRGESVAYVTTAFAADRAHFRRHLLEGMTLGLLCRFDRTPVHAAAVGRAGCAVLLAGPSGSGKSTLAYAAHRAGLDVLADDHVWVQLEPKLRVWGWPGRVLLLPETASMFPGTVGAGRTSDANGGHKLAYDVAGIATVSSHLADRAVVCIVEPKRGKASLERLSPEDVVHRLTGQLTSGFDLFADQQDTVLRTLAGAGGWRLTLSTDPGEALPLLERMLDE